MADLGRSYEVIGMNWKIKKYLRPYTFYLKITHYSRIPPIFQSHFVFLWEVLNRMK